MSVHGIFINRGEFDPPKLVIRAGDTVRWTNKDTVLHAVLADENADGEVAFRSPDLRYNHTFEVPLTEPGEFTYHCPHHPDMVGCVEIQ